MPNTLTLKQEVFIAEYLKDGNATRSALAAGYAKKSAHVTGCKLLKVPKISEELELRRDNLLKKHGVEVDEIVGILCAIARCDTRKFYNEDGTFKQITELDADTAAAIAGFETEKLYEHFAKGGAKEIGTVSKIKWADKVRACELLGRWKKMWSEKQDIHINFNLAERIQRARLSLPQ